MYSIGTASKLSGVPAETIRIWERRYDVPSPARSAGGHRQYSDGDVELLRALKALIDDGARIGSVAGESREEILRAARVLTGPSEADEASDGERSVDYEPLVEALIEAAQKKDTAAAARILNRPLLHRHAREVVLGLYLPALREVGDLWHRGEISISSEHFVEKQITGRLHSILVNREENTQGPRALLACLPEERHETGLLAAAVLLKLAGYQVTYLGADLPLDELRSAAAETRPRVALLSATVAPSAGALREIADALGEPSLLAATVLVGGAGAKHVAEVCGDAVTHIASLDELEAVATSIARAS